VTKALIDHFKESGMKYFELKKAILKIIVDSCGLIL
jgi:hypothetical protein